VRYYAVRDGEGVLYEEWEYTAGEAVSSGVSILKWRGRDGLFLLTSILGDRYGSVQSAFTVTT
jgi:hypothetical protein